MQSPGKHHEERVQRGVSNDIVGHSNEEKNAGFDCGSGAVLGPQDPFIMKDASLSWSMFVLGAVVVIWCGSASLAARAENRAKVKAEPATQTAKQSAAPAPMQVTSRTAADEARNAATKSLEAASEEVSKSHGLDINKITESLSGAGLDGEIHAADPGNRQFVLTVRDPKDFFNFQFFVMVTHDQKLLEQLHLLHRHDLVRIKGEFFHQGEFADESPQMHIEVKGIEVLKPYTTTLVAHSKFMKQTVLPEDLRDKTEGDFLVHAVLKNGAVLVLEYKDNFVFVVVPDRQFTAKLFRNDRIHMRFHLQKFPEHPTHLDLDTDTSAGKKPIEVIDSIAALHGKSFTQEGALVRFPRSPQIIRDVWAIEQKGSDGNSRTFTLVNFDDPREQSLIDSKLKSWWDEKDNSFVDGRNKLVSTKIRIKASGTMNVVDPNQANAQMKLNAADLVRLP